MNSVSKPCLFRTSRSHPPSTSVLFVPSLTTSLSEGRCAQSGGAPFSSILIYYRSCWSTTDQSPANHRAAHCTPLGAYSPLTAFCPQSSSSFRGQNPLILIGTSNAVWSTQAGARFSSLQWIGFVVGVHGSLFPPDAGISSCSGDR